MKYAVACNLSFNLMIDADSEEEAMELAELRIDTEAATIPTKDLHDLMFQPAEANPIDDSDLEEE